VCVPLAPLKLYQELHIVSISVVVFLFLLHLYLCHFILQVRFYFYEDISVFSPVSGQNWTSSHRV